MKNRTNVRWLTQLALLVAILLVMNYTPLGYLQVGPLSASLLSVPVAIGAMTMGPLAGAILGAAFGITSFLQAMEGKSLLSAAMFNANPAGTFVVCVVSRVLVGLCAALLFKALCKALPKQEKFCCFAGGLLTAVLNTVFFMGALVLLFYDLPYVQEAAQSMGATNWQIITRVLLPESLPSLLNGATIVTTTILSYSAMAGALGGGGLGAIAINYGYYRYQEDVMWVAVVLLVILVQIFQVAGDKLTLVSDKRRR